MDAIFFVLMVVTIVVSVGLPEGRQREGGSGGVTIGPSAKLRALRRMIDVCPDARAVTVVDHRGVPIGRVLTAQVRELPSEVVASSILIVADVMTRAHAA